MFAEQGIRSIVLFPRDPTQEERVLAGVENETVLAYPDDDTRYALAPLLGHEVTPALSLTSPHTNTL